MNQTIRASLGQLRRQIRARVEPLLARIVCRWAPRLSLSERFHMRERLSQLMPLDYAAHPIQLHVNGLLEAEMRTHSCAKEPGTVAWIESHLRPGDVLYDIGANVGAYALIAAKHVANQATIFAFEPSFDNFAQLCRNVLLNETQASIIPLATPLGRQTGLGDFHFASLASGAAMHSFGRATDYRGERFTPAASLRAIGWSLDDLVKRSRLPAPNLIKIDVDGLELDILEGATSILGDPTLRTILVEVNEELDEQCLAVLQLLHSTGLFPSDKHYLRGRAYNYVFERAERLPAQPTDPDAIPVTWERGRPNAARRAIA